MQARGFLAQTRQCGRVVRTLARAEPALFHLSFDALTDVFDEFGLLRLCREREQPSRACGPDSQALWRVPQERARMVARQTCVRRGVTGGKR